jgi:hypothetical protein
VQKGTDVVTLNAYVALQGQALHALALAAVVGPTTCRHPSQQTRVEAPHAIRKHVVSRRLLRAGVGIGIDLWQAGVFSRIAPVWIGVIALVALGLGIMMEVSSGKPQISGSSTMSRQVRPLSSGKS